MTLRLNDRQSKSDLGSIRRCLKVNKGNRPKLQSTLQACHVNKTMQIRKKKYCLCGVTMTSPETKPVEKQRLPLTPQRPPTTTTRLKDEST